MKPKPQVGQRLFSLNVGNNARGRPQILTPVVVSKVGRKYFEAAPDGCSYATVSYRLEDWGEVTDYTANSSLYETEQEWLDEREAHQLYNTIRETFSYSPRFCKLPLSTLRKIVALIESSASTTKNTDPCTPR